MLKNLNTGQLAVELGFKFKPSVRHDRIWTRGMILELIASILIKFAAD